MTILIIEDEVKTAKALERLILSVRPDAEIVGVIQSVQTAVKYLSGNPQPALIFMDIQLSDGLCFGIFSAVKVEAPVIFCTAYDEYAIEAFKANGIDYILKPFSQDTLAAAFEKVRRFENYFQAAKPQAPDISVLLQLAGQSGGKKSFLVFSNNKYLTVPTDNIAYFYIRHEATTIVTFDREEYPIQPSLEEVHNQLPPRQFFRINRQYLVNFSAVKEVEHYFARKLLVHLKVPTGDELLIGKDKTTAFLAWLEER
ncbi:LytR/AlgR family response regulator transcription factor [Chitinophaga japonensis]|uniref:LytTR family two component transcriptional regulator n=1 Tax=Chitinophaga japonensis TaxID=104662 RepID=A0A562T637_CHIJA|nr:LytTR family DNA-binding domain-containing protein [Chitinophaga japonensis]TWI88470.1 LytTR family two component transcriptional regulator [Chitinophaga japonensis]